MKRMITIGAAALALALAISGCAYNTANSQWIPLIDGEKGMENFNALGGANWRPEAGAIVADKSTIKGSSVLVSKRSFKDFEVYAEFWADHDTNSGLYIRCTNPTNVSSASAYEAQIWDQNLDQARSTGALMQAATVPVPPIYKSGGRWNTMEIYARGDHMTVKLNGVVTVNVMNGDHKSGPIALQQNNGWIKWRKVLVREL
ncbi:MAG: hypothetical protein JWN94_4203 [Betaproteobacteria bacterium]|nr:hypothetical protein [Betaproteobacteria bacterium]